MCIYLHNDNSKIIEKIPIKALISNNFLFRSFAIALFSSSECPAFSGHYIYPEGLTKQ